MTGTLIPSLQKLNANKLDNLDKMDTFLERHKVLKLTQGETENLNAPITRDQQ